MIRKEAENSTALLHPHRTLPPPPRLECWVFVKDLLCAGLLARVIWGLTPVPHSRPSHCSVPCAQGTLCRHLFGGRKAVLAIPEQTPHPEHEWHHAWLRNVVPVSVAGRGLFLSRAWRRDPPRLCSFDLRGKWVLWIHLSQGPHSGPGKMCL